MFKWMKAYKESDRQVQIFTLNWVIYAIAIILTTIYCYGRLDFVRSYPTPSRGEATHIEPNKGKE